MSPDDVADVILSYNDPNLIANVFRQMGWTPTLEIIETLKVVRQDMNPGAKLRAIKYLRELLREAAEAAGLIANVSQSRPLPGGGHTTFSAKRIVSAMNPGKQIESTQIEEPKDGEKREEKPNRNSTGEESRDPSAGEIDNRRIAEGGSGCEEINSDGKYKSPGGEGIPTEHVPNGHPTSPPEAGVGQPGSSEPAHRGVAPGQAEESDTNDAFPPSGETEIPEQLREGETGNPCVQTRKPDCDRTLFPGISGSSSGAKQDSSG